jgi:hypothetical protein
MANVIERLEPVFMAATVTLNSGGTATSTSGNLDLAGCSAAAIHISFGTIAGSSTVSVFKIEESEDGSTAWATVVDMSADFSATVDDSQFFVRINAGPRRRYVRCVVTVSSATNVVLNGVYGIRHTSPIDAVAAGNAKGAYKLYRLDG